MVHLIYNAAERRKSAVECKIRAYIPIYPEMLLQSVPNQTGTIQNAGADRPETISRRGSRADCITLSRRSRSEKLCTISALTDRAKPEQLATVSPRRIFRGSPVRGVCSRFTAHLLSCQESAFCGFLRIFQPNCTKLLLCAITKTRKTAHLLAFCKHAAFQTNFCWQFLPDFCDLYGL